MGTPKEQDKTYTLLYGTPDIFDDLDIAKAFIREVLEMRGPDPLTEDWRPIPGYESYSINRCGEVLNARGWIIKPTSVKYRNQDGTLVIYDTFGLYRDGVRTFHPMRPLLEQLFKEDYI
jgi:hypothetical protein